MRMWYFTCWDSETTPTVLRLVPNYRRCIDVDWKWRWTDLGCVIYKCMGMNRWIQQPIVSLSSVCKTSVGLIFFLSFLHKFFNLSSLNVLITNTTIMYLEMFIPLVLMAIRYWLCAEIQGRVLFSFSSPSYISNQSDFSVYPFFVGFYTDEDLSLSA